MREDSGFASVDGALSVQFVKVANSHDISHMQCVLYKTD